MDPKQDANGPKKDILAEIDLPALFKRREETTEKQRKAAEQFQAAKAAHFVLFWISGGSMLIAVIWLAPLAAEHETASLFLIAAGGIFWIGLWIAAFLPSLTVRRYQDEANAVARQLREVDGKIAFAHQVQKEAETVKVRRYAEALDKREAAKEEAPKKAS